MVKKDKAKKKDKTEAPKAPPASGVLSSEITRASRSMRTFLTNTLGTSGIYAGQEGVILALAASEGLTAGAIAAKLGVKPPTMTRTLSRMEAQGFLRRIADEADGRQSKAVLTDEGQKHVDAIGYAIKAAEALALTGLSDKEIRQFAKTLRKINRNMGQADASDDSFSE